MDHQQQQQQELDGRIGVSWHLRYYDNSYLVYVAFGTIVVSFFTAVYCCKVGPRFRASIKRLNIKICFN